MVHPFVASVGRASAGGRDGAGAGGGDDGGGGGRSLGPWLLAVPGLGIVASHVYFLRLGETNPVDASLGWVAPALLVAVLAYALWWVTGEGHDDRRATRVGVWFVGGGLALGASAALLVLFQGEVGGAVVEPGYTVLTWGTGGGVLGVVLGLYAATRRAATERERAARERAEALNRRLSILNRVLRHELRNEINVIQGNAQVLIDVGVDQQSWLREIRAVASDLMEVSERARQVEEVLDENPGTGGRSTVDVAAATREHVDRVRSDHPGVLFDVAVPGSVEALAHDVIDDAIGEVLDNAVEHNDGEFPRVEVSVRAREDDRVEVRVGDNGPGIPDRAVSVVEEGRETGMQHSHGLGLWLAASVTRASGGELQFEDNEPSGSVVRFVLDAAGPEGSA